MPDIFKVDGAKCVKCGLCVQDCAFRALRMESDGPRMAFPDKCMKCQHCLAVCPAGAVAFDGRRPEDCIPVRDAPVPGLDEAEGWLRTRRSMRRFAPQDADRATLERILSALGNSPTGCNARSLTFTCLPSRESMDRFRRDFISAIERHRDGPKLLPRWLAIPALRLRKGEEDVFFRGATGMLVVSSDDKAPGVTTPREDVTIACAHFELLANAAGIATCWCGFLRMVQQEVPELLEETLGLRRDAPFYAMLFGLPAVKYARGVKRDSYARVEFR